MRQMSITLRMLLSSGFHVQALIEMQEFEDPWVRMRGRGFACFVMGVEW